MTTRRSIAIVGSGVAGLTCAHLLDPHHDITVFEADDRLGGHANTVAVEISEPTGRRQHMVDTGFIVFNEHNYPGFVRLLERLGVDSHPSEMSFSVMSARSGVEYRGTNPNTIFGQRSNLLRPSFLRMLVEITRFNRLARTELLDADPALTLADVVVAKRFSRRFVDEFLVPLGSAIWSADPTRFLEFPARSYANFMNNHGLLEVRGRPDWRTITGGSIVYVQSLARRLQGDIRLGTPVHSIRRHPDGVSITSDAGEEHFDDVILACHSDQALRLLTEPSDAERSILGSIRYQPNVAVLHTDDRLLPRTRRCWASWNYRIGADESTLPTLTYWMNNLQSIDSTATILVTLNMTDEIDPSKVIARFDYAHPILDSAAVAAQGRRGEIQGRDHTYFAGAWWGHGFHEDGVHSALDVCRRFGVEL